MTPNGTVLPVKIQTDMKALTPCRMIVNRELQFHNLVLFLQRYEIFIKYPLPIIYFFVPLHRLKQK